MKTERTYPSVAEFADRVQEYLARMREQDMPMVLSVNGEAAVVVFDLRLYEHLARCGDREFGELLRGRIKAIGSGEDRGETWESLKAELLRRGLDSREV